MTLEELIAAHAELLTDVQCGVSCPAGWVPLVDALCRVIEHRNPVQHVIVDQVKEKFGGLRFYFHGGDEHVQGAVDLAERLSEVTCQDCGARGERRGGAWIRTLCRGCDPGGRR